MLFLACIYKSHHIPYLCPSPSIIDMDFTSPCIPKLIPLPCGTPSFLLAHKWHCLPNSKPQFVVFMPPVPSLLLTPFCFAPGSGEVAGDEPAVLPLLSTVVDWEQYSMQMLHAELHKKWQEFVTQEQSNKQTKDSCGRHITAYQLWWDHIYQLQELQKDLELQHLPAFLITAVKATMFLAYESMWPKVCCLPSLLLLVSSDLFNCSANLGTQLKSKSCQT